MITLIIDGNNVAYKAFYTTGALSANGLPTGVLFGTLKIVFSVCKKLKPDNVVFTFDSEYNKRKEIDLGYKANRKPVNDEQAEQRQYLYKQINDLQLIVRRMGFPIYREDGYEADDLVASLIVNNEEPWERNDFIILSTDKDLYQLLAGNVNIWTMTKDYSIFTRSDFHNSYKICPKQWPWVKAVIGDPSDNIIGINGVGEKSAINYLLGEKISDKRKQLIEGNTELIEKNLELVRLPFDGTPKLELEYHSFNPKVFFNIIRRYKMYSLKTEEWEKLFCPQNNFQKNKKVSYNI